MDDDRGGPLDRLLGPIYRALLAGGVVERLDAPDHEGRTLRLTVDLQLDFALNQPLSPFALAALELLHRDSPAYPLDILSVIRSTPDNPRQVLSAQQFKARGGRADESRRHRVRGADEPARLGHPSQAAGRSAGVAFEAYRRGHRWVADHRLSPKSVVRNRYEGAMTFVEYVGYSGSWL